jgi:hypothetical protein
MDGLKLLGSSLQLMIEASSKLISTKTFAHRYSRGGTLQLETFSRPRAEASMICLFIQSMAAREMNFNESNLVGCA